MRTDGVCSWTSSGPPRSLPLLALSAGDGLNSEHVSIFPSPRCFRMQGVTASCAFLQVRLNHSFQRTEKKGLLTLTLSCSISASLSVPSAFTSFVFETFPAALALLRKPHSLVSDNFGAAHSVLIAVLTFQLTPGSPLSADKPVQMLCSRASEQIWKVG